MHSLYNWTVIIKYHNHINEATAILAKELNNHLLKYLEEMEETFKLLFLPSIKKNSTPSDPFKFPVTCSIVLLLTNY